MKVQIFVAAVFFILLAVLFLITGNTAALLAMTATVAFFSGVLWLLYRLYLKRNHRKKQHSPLSPTLMWMNTAGSILLAANPYASFSCMGGYGTWMEDERILQMIKKTLWDYWGIQSRATAEKEMRSLLNHGMRSDYGKRMMALDQLYHDFTEVQLIETTKKKNPKADEDSYLPKMMMSWRRYGENALLGWDAGRCALICQWCYLAGYLDMETMLGICVDAGKKAQAVFQSWEEMMESYLLGIQYWRGEDRNTRGSMTAERWKLYEKLWRGEKPYGVSPYLSVPFDLPLSKEIVTDKFGVMK